MSKLKAFADDKLNIVKIMEPVLILPNDKILDWSKFKALERTKQLSLRI